MVWVGLEIAMADNTIFITLQIISEKVNIHL
jgi:hypothetical protein